MTWDKDVPPIGKVQLPCMDLIEALAFNKPFKRSIDDDWYTDLAEFWRGCDGEQIREDAMASDWMVKTE